MAIFEGVVSGLGSVADKLGFNFLTGNLIPPIPAPITVAFAVEDFYPGGPVFHTGGFILNVPNHSTEFGELAINMAQEALVLVELAIALQTISDPKGGIKIKDSLDPYHYNVIKNALEENGDTVPPTANPGATLLTQLGGAIIETGALSAIATGADAMRTAGFFSDFLKLTPQLDLTGPGNIPFAVPGPDATPPGPFNLGNVGTPIQVAVSGRWPSYSFAINVMSSAAVIKTIILQYIVSLFRNSIDTEAGALLLKNVMSDFTVAVSKNAIEKTDKQAPDDTQQEGQSGIF